MWLIWFNVFIVWQPFHKWWNQCAGVFKCLLRDENSWAEQLMPLRRIPFDLASSWTLHSRKTIKQFHCAHSHPQCKCRFMENKQTIRLLMCYILCLRSLCAFMQHHYYFDWMLMVYHLCGIYNDHICTETSKTSNLRLELLCSPTFSWGPLGVGRYLHAAGMSIQTFLPLLFEVFSCKGQEVLTPKIMKMRT